MKNNKIEIYINGEQELVAKGISLQKILEKFSIKNKLIAIELNKEVIPKSQYRMRKVIQNDRIEIVELIGGG